MSDFLRRLYNQVDSAFDRRTLEIERRYSRPGGNAKRPVTAAGAFARVKPLASELDRGALLKSIVSQAGADRNGASPRWEFAFDLPARRAQLYCVWSLPLEASADDYGPALVEANARPFPAPDSPLRLLAREGKLLNRQRWRATMVGSCAPRSSRCARAAPPKGPSPGSQRPDMRPTSPFWHKIYVPSIFQLQARPDPASAGACAGI